jgi:hypothetical protein
MTTCDEVTHADISQSFLLRGTFSRDFMGPYNPQYANVTVQGRIYHIQKAAWQAIAGPSNLTSRAFSILGGWLRRGWCLSWGVTCSMC